MKKPDNDVHIFIINGGKSRSMCRKAKAFIRAGYKVRVVRRGSADIYANGKLQRLETNNLHGTELGLVTYNEDHMSDEVLKFLDKTGEIKKRR